MKHTNPTRQRVHGLRQPTCGSARTTIETGMHSLARRVCIE